MPFVMPTRHGFEAGESVVTVAERLGHDNAAQVIKTYAHLMPGYEERTHKAIDNAWTRQSDESRTAGS